MGERRNDRTAELAILRVLRLLHIQVELQRVAVIGSRCNLTLALELPWKSVDQHRNPEMEFTAAIVPAERERGELLAHDSRRFEAKFSQCVSHLRADNWRVRRFTLGV